MDERNAPTRGEGGAQRLWWREEIVSEASGWKRAGNETVGEAAVPSVAHAPIVDADEFDTLWDELEAEAARRAENVQTAARVGSMDSLSAVTVPIQLETALRRDRETSRRNYRAFTLLFGVMAIMSLAVLLLSVLSGKKFPTVFVSNLVVVLVNLNLQWRTNRDTQKRLDDWETRTDWRVSVRRTGLTVVTPWTNEGIEETLPWNLIHDIKSVMPPVRGVKERFFCVVRRDGLDNNGKPVLPRAEDRLTPKEKRRLAWRRFLSQERPAPKLPPPILIPESALPMSADALVARIAVWETGQGDYGTGLRSETRL